MHEENLEEQKDNEELNDERDGETPACVADKDVVWEIGSPEDGAENGAKIEEPEELPSSVIEKLKNDLAMARADLYNYRQQAVRERIKNRKLIAEDKIAEFLPVIDNLDRALNVPEDGSAKDVLVGVRMVQRQFLSILENSDVTVIPAEGCAFDHALHEAVETEYVDDPEQDGLVLYELMRGYRTPERVLRATHVRVGRLRS